jgi:hypothetical protein
VSKLILPAHLMARAVSSHLPSPTPVVREPINLEVHKAQLANGRACLEIFDRMATNAIMSSAAHRTIMVAAAVLMIDKDVDALKKLEVTLTSANN